jgi:sigma-B regulation protein RsbU (phosphoserine phosphatase)
LHSGGVIHQLDADGPAVGMVPELPFETRTIAVAEKARLLIFSDGVFEIEKPDGQMWQYPEFVEQISPGFERESDLIEHHLKFVRELSRQETLGDDFSMVEVRF